MSDRARQLVVLKPGIFQPFIWGKNGILGLTLKIRSEVNTGLGDFIRFVLI
jgi:hypothetical protein